MSLVGSRLRDWRSAGRQTTTFIPTGSKGDGGGRRSDDGFECREKDREEETGGGGGGRGESSSLVCGGEEREGRKGRGLGLGKGVRRHTDILNEKEEGREMKFPRELLWYYPQVRGRRFWVGREEGRYTSTAQSISEKVSSSKGTSLSFPQTCVCVRIGFLANWKWELKAIRRELLALRNDREEEEKRNRGILKSLSLSLSL